MAENGKMKYDVFISYSSNDQIIADGILNYLEKNKIRCFIAYRDIPKGLDWAKFIPGALRNSKLMLAIFSKNFNDSEQTDNEISIAANRHIPTLVFRITDDDFDGSKEYFLTKSNWIEAFPNPERLFGDLYRNVCYLLGIKQEQSDEDVKQAPVVETGSVIPGEEFVNKGMKLFYSEDGDKEMAVYYFHKAAKMGNAQGEYMNGMAYFMGCGIHNSWKSAFDCFSKAIKNGSLDAMVQLALMYRYGIGIERNSMKALELYMKAAEHGNGRAMRELGNIFKTGELGIQDNEKSEEYYSQAYEVFYESAMGDNDPIAQHSLGTMYLDGEGVKRSYTQAIKFFERAIKNNYPPAFNSLGLCYDNGTGVAADINKAFEYQRKSAMMGFPTAMNNLSLCYNKGTGVDKDIEKYHEWQMKAAECGNVSALCNIGLDYWVGESQSKDIYKAKKWFEKAVEAGSLRAMSCLGNMYENGEIDDPQGKEKAVKLYKQAAISGDVISMKCIATCYYYGNGTKVDKVNAAHWYLKIAEIYQKMIANDDSNFVNQLGAGTRSDYDFDATYQSIFADCFENLAYMYRKGEGGLEVNSLLADKWTKVCRVLRGEVENVEESDDIRELENAARKNNSDALDRLLTIYEERGNRAKIEQWSTFAVQNKVLVKKADYIAGIDHLGLVLANAKVEDHQIYVEYLKELLASAHEGNYKNSASLYNAICEEYKKGKMQLSNDDFALIRNDTNELFGDISFTGYLRCRKEHFDILFPNYNPDRILNGDFTNERDFLLFYAEHTDHSADLSVSNLGIEDMFAILRNDKSYSAVVQSKNGYIVNSGNLHKCISNYIYAYTNLCNENPKIQKVELQPFDFDMMAPIAMPEQMQTYSLQFLKALISVKGIFGDKWKKILDNIMNLDALLDVAETLSDEEDLQLLLIEYVEFAVEFEKYLVFAQRLLLIYLDSKKQGYADELNAYVRRMEENNIAHSLPYFTIDNVPNCLLDYDSDNETETETDDNEIDDNVEITPNEMFSLGYNYYNGQNGKPKDYAQAVYWYDRGAQKGNAASQCNLGFCYERGEGVQKDLVAAFQWYLKSAENGDDQGQCNVGNCYESGIGTDKNPEQAARWYRAAAEQGHVSGQYNYARCLKNGLGVKVNAVEAIEWYNKSAAQGNDKAMDILGDCYYKGEGVEKDILKAKEWYEKAAAKGNKYSIESLKKIEEESDNSLHCIKGQNGRYGYANAAGKVVRPCIWTYAKDFVDDVALVWDGKKMGAINRKGEFYFECKISCQTATYLGHNLINVYKGSLYSLYTLEGKDELMELFESLDDKFENGFVKAVKYRLFGKNKPGKIDTSGKFIPD